MKVRRLNLALSDGDFAVVRRMANYNRLPVGTWARQALIAVAVRSIKSAQADGTLADYEQLELFGTKPHKSKGGRT